jgi:extracellular elastinolytic metalloproteinase
MGSAPNGFSHDLEYMIKSNCEIFNLPSSFDAEDISDCCPALLKFMATATPDPWVASDILNHFSLHKDAMTVTLANHFTSPTGKIFIEFTVDNVPDTINPVEIEIGLHPSPK